MEVQLQAAELMRRPEAALRAVQKPPAKPWRGGAGPGGSSSAASQPPPPKVYRVEPREFRDLVQRLTGAPPTTRRHMPPSTPPMQPVPVRAAAASEHHHHQQQLYGSSPSWFSFPLAGVDASGSSTGGLMQ